MGTIYMKHALLAWRELDVVHKDTLINTTPGVLNTKMFTFLISFTTFNDGAVYLYCG